MVWDGLASHRSRFREFVDGTEDGLVLGRFLSADPFVQFPDTTQGFNRYSYVSNNPLSFVDPTGHEQDELDSFEDVSPPDFDDGYDPGDDNCGLGFDEGGIGGLFEDDGT